MDSEMTYGWMKTCQELYMIIFNKGIKVLPYAIHSVLLGNWSVALDKCYLTSFGKTAEKWTTKSPPNPSYMSSSGRRTNEPRHYSLTLGLMCPQEW